MIQKDIELITIDDLQELKINSVGESKTLEYKKELNLTKDQDKKEFLADFSAFANTSGGDLIYGITEKSGIPEVLEGMKIDNIDTLKQQIDNILRDCIEPRVTGYFIKEILKESGTYFLIVRIPKSWTSPHRVIFKDSKKFYGRNTSGKYELDITELRGLFALSDSIGQRLKEFRENRVLKIISDDTPRKLAGERRVVIHIVPLISLNLTQRYDIKIVKRKAEFAFPFCSIGCDTSYNFDGIISFDEHGTTANSYTQFFTNGIIESVTSKLDMKTDEGVRFIPNTFFESNMFKTISKYLEFYKEARIDFPVYLFVTFVNYKGVYLAVDNSFMNYRQNAIDRDILSIPEVYIENNKYNFHTILRPIFDTLWNSCGYERCLNYDENGRYNPK